MAEQSQKEDRFAPSQDGSTPDSCKSYCSFWVVQEAVDATVSQFGRLIEEEVAKEPSKFAQSNAGQFL